MKRIIIILLIAAFPLSLFADVGIGPTVGALDEVLTFGPAEPPEFWVAGLNIRWKQSILFLDVSGQSHLFPTIDWDDTWVFLNMGLCFDLFFLRISGGPGLLINPVYDYNMVYKEEGRWPWRFSGKLNVDAKLGPLTVGVYINLWLYIDPELGLQSTNVGFFGASILYWF